MFNPSQEDVRRFFCAVHAKSREAAPMDALETLAGQWLAEHPEYHPEVADAEAAVARVRVASEHSTMSGTSPLSHISRPMRAASRLPRGLSGRS